MDDEHDVIVVGAGLAGLTAAKVLQAAGKDVQVLEAHSLGGRVRSREIEGFTFDRGFQVLFTAYPAIKRQLNLDKLELINIPPAASLYHKGKKQILADPIRDATKLIATLSANVLSWRDKFLVAKLAFKVKRMPAYTYLEQDQETTLAFLQGFGFSQNAIQAFFMPFFGGIFLSRDLLTSSGLFFYYFRMLIEGAIAIPRQGMGAISRQLAEGLKLQEKTKLEHLEPFSDGVLLHTSQGVIKAKTAVIATDLPEIKRLLQLDVRFTPLKSTYLYYRSSQLNEDSRLILGKTGLINHAIWLSSLHQPWAAAGQGLLCVAVLEDQDLDDEGLDMRVRAELAAWYGEALSKKLDLLLVERLPMSQFSQPVGFSQQLLPHATDHHNVFIASELNSMSSIQGAMESGERLAALMLKDELASNRPRGA